MPYILPEVREEIRRGNFYWKNSSPGEINYMVSTLMNDYLEANGINYTNVNTLVGVLECAKLELYRRIAVPCEEQKKFENGDVYSESLI